MVLLTVRTHGPIVQILAIYVRPARWVKQPSTHRWRTCRPTG